MTMQDGLLPFADATACLNLNPSATHSLPRHHVQLMPGSTTNDRIVLPIMIIGTW